MLLGLGVLALCVTYAALVVCSASYSEVRRLDLIFPFYGEPIRVFTAAAFTRFQLMMGASSLMLVLILGALRFSVKSRQEFASLGSEVYGLWQNLWSSLTARTKAQRYQAGIALAALTLVRVYLSIDNPAYDDAVSYEVFVSKGLLATTAYYPIPNNHVFSNSISVLFYQLSPKFWWTMRLPVLLVSTGVTLFLFAGLNRLAGFRTSFAAVALFSCLQLSLYHAGVGRGYWLMIGLAGVVFFSTLVLSSGRGHHQAAWAAMALAGVLGCYTVPPFVYALASAFSWLGISYLYRRQWTQAGQTFAVGIVIGAGSMALYGPLLFVSGPAHLLGNGYVASLKPALFWDGLPSYVWHNEGFLAGQRTLGAFITLPVLALVAWLLYLGHANRLPPAPAHRLHRLGLPALWFMSFPYALILVQRVFPPERVLLYKAFFFFVVVGLVLDWALEQGAKTTRHRLQAVLAVVIAAFVTYQTYSVIRVNPAARGSNAAYHAGLQWLAAQPPGPALIPEPTHNLFFRFYAHSEMPERQWQMDDVQLGHKRYAYVVAFPNKRGFFQPLFNFPPAYRNQEVDIYRVPPNYPLNANAWRH